MIQSVTVTSPANIAFIKYWGQKNDELVLPFHDSFSMNLSGCVSTVTIQRQQAIKDLTMQSKFYGQTEFSEANSAQLHKIKQFFDFVHQYLNIPSSHGYSITSENSFPHKAGIASSASFYAGLTLGLVTLLEAEISQAEMSMLARMSGSGSAARSIPDGFVWWHKGNGETPVELMKSSVAESIAAPNYWDIADLVVLLTQDQKKVGSQAGHKGAVSSAFFPDRLLSVDERLKTIRTAFDHKDFATFGKIMEEDTLSMHLVMMTQNPPLYFWSGKTLEVMKQVVNLREQGMHVYFSIDAGENVHVICQKADEAKIAAHFRQQPDVLNIIHNDPAPGARVTQLV